MDTVCCDDVTISCAASVACHAVSLYNPLLVPTNAGTTICIYTFVLSLPCHANHMCRHSDTHAGHAVAQANIVNRLDWCPGWTAHLRQNGHFLVVQHRNIVQT